MKRAPKSYALRAVLGGAVIVIASLGSSWAANIVIGDSEGKTEFGQGEFTLKACDSWIQLNLMSGSTDQFDDDSEGLSALTGITIQGLDAQRCKSTKFLLQAFDGSANLLPLYRTVGESKLCSSSVCTIGRNSEAEVVITVSESKEVALESPNQYHSISFDDTLGIYRIIFVKPTQLARDITNLTIQSSSL
jgi:hypothetical protein